MKRWTFVILAAIFGGLEATQRPNIIIIVADDLVILIHGTVVKRWLLTPEIRGSNPFVSNFYLLSTTFKRRKERKRGHKSPIKNYYNFNIKVEMHVNCTLNY